MLPQPLERDLGSGVTLDVNNVSLSQKYAVACLLAVAIYNAVEMLPVIYFTFTRYAGLYFWSMVASDLGVLIYSTGYVMNNFRLTGNQTLPTIMACTAWVPMVSAQSLVLYSRLHLVNLSRSVRRVVLVMILFNGIVLHTSTSILTIGSNGVAAQIFLEPYAIVERVQVTIFFLQELILSGLYVWKAREFLGTFRRQRGVRGDRAHQNLRSMMIHLILSNVMIVLLDIAILVFEYLGLYFVQVSYKGFVYSVKLKCEIGILNCLVDFVKSATAAKQHLPHNFHQHGGARLGKGPGCKSSHNFAMTSQIEREWETTLRNTFGVAMVEGRRRGSATCGEEGDGGGRIGGNWEEDEGRIAEEHPGVLVTMGFGTASSALEQDAADADDGGSASSVLTGGTPEEQGLGPPRVQRPGPSHAGGLSGNVL